MANPPPVSRLCPLKLRNRRPRNEIQYEDASVDARSLGGAGGGTALVASGETGAYFSQTVPGSISGTVGSIHITPSTSTDLSFSNLLPGAPQTVTVHFENTGSSRRTCTWRSPTPRH